MENELMYGVSFPMSVEAQRDDFVLPVNANHSLYPIPSAY